MPVFRYSALALLMITLVCGCGGVMDYRSRPVDIHGELIGVTSASDYTPILAGSPMPGHASKDCAEAFRRGDFKPCFGRQITPGPDGTFQSEIPGSMRGCPYLLIPPLLDTFCDRKSYVVVALPTNPVEVYQITISPKGSTRIIGPYPGSGKPANDHLRVIQSRQVSGTEGARTETRDSIELRVDLR